MLELILTDGSTFPHKGKITFADRQIDPMTGTIKVATLFPNPGNLLRPGQFAKVRARMGIESECTAGSATCGHGNAGETTWWPWSDPDNKVRHPAGGNGSACRFSLQVVSKGLKPGEKIVAEGIQKVKEGMTVIPKPFVPQEQGRSETTGKTTPESPHRPAGKR